LHRCLRRLPTSRLHRLFLVASLALVPLPALAEVGLQPTRAGLLRQSAGARDAGAIYLANDQQVHDAVRSGQLVVLRGNDDYFVHPDVRHSAARPDVKLFVERLASQYRGACGERLVVTSLVRPRNHQPWNSDPLSVHPPGMAVDLRISTTTACRRWLETTLVELEGQGLVEAARERVVPHYHVVVFSAYAQQLERNGISISFGDGTRLASFTPAEPIPMLAGLPTAAEPGVTRELALASQAPPRVLPAVQRSTPTRATAAPRKSSSTHRSTSGHASSRRYKVRRGDTLWTIAKRHGVSLTALRRANRLPKRLQPGQVLSIPAR
jgi:hypothetical protein